MRTLSALVMALLLTSSARAADMDDVVAALKEKITLTKVSLLSDSISSAGTPLVTQREGLTVGDPDTLNKRTKIKNGEISSLGGGVMGGSLFGNASSGRQLKLNDKIYVCELRTNPRRDGIWLKIMTMNTYDVTKNGRTISQRGELIIDMFWERAVQMTNEEVLADFARWFRTEAESSEAMTVKLGQNQSDVERILGAPDKRIDLGAKKVLVYKDMKIVLVDGKVSDVQ